MRKVYVHNSYGKKDENPPVGIFHQFSTCETEGSADAIAIVEMPDGRIVTPYAGFIQFVEPEQKSSMEQHLTAELKAQNDRAQKEFAGILARLAWVERENVALEKERGELRRLLRDIHLEYPTITPEADIAIMEAIGWPGREEDKWTS